MKKAIIVLGLLVGTAFIVSANGNGRDNNRSERQNVETTERQRDNVVDTEDCTLDEVGTGYLNEDNRKNKNQSNSKGQGRNRK